MGQDCPSVLLYMMHSNNNNNNIVASVVMTLVTMESPLGGINRGGAYLRVKTSC